MNIKDFGYQNPTNPTKNDDNPNKKYDFEEIKKTKEFKAVEDEYGDFVKDFLNNYSQKSESELIQEILKLIAQKKAEGTFDADKIKQLAKVIEPLLDDEQKAKMYTLLKYLD